MIKLSEALKMYKDKRTSDPVEEYFSETKISKKIGDIEKLIRILGDVEFEVDSLKAFLYELDKIVVGRFGISEEDALKLEDLKKDYGEEFISKIQSIVKERIVPFEKAISILPSKELIDSSTTKVPFLGYTITSGEDLVTRRLRGYITDDKIEQTDMDDYIILGITSAGDYVYTSFTKRGILNL